MNEYHHRLTVLARYFFDINIGQIIQFTFQKILDNILHFGNLVLRLITILNINKIIDKNETSQLEFDTEPIKERILNLRRLERMIPKFVTSYFVLFPLLFEIWSMFFAGLLIRLWVLGSFSVTFICIWSIVTSRSEVSETISKILGRTDNDFDLTDFLKISGFITICISILICVISVFTFDVPGFVLSLSVSNRTYRNIQTYLMLIKNEK